MVCLNCKDYYAHLSALSSVQLALEPVRDGLPTESAARREVQQRDAIVSGFTVAALLPAVAGRNLLKAAAIERER
jgi:hypothetical protein